MKKIHIGKPKSRVQIGIPFELAIRDILLPKTNKDNLSDDWNETDWVRYCIAREIARRNGGKVPKNCLDMLKDFIPDLEI